MRTNSTIHLEILAEKYGPKISTVACRMIRDKEVAKEAAQEVWIQILKSLKTFRGDSSLSTWIYTIARRTIMRYAIHEKTYNHYQIKGFFDQGEIAIPDGSQAKNKWVKEKCDDCLTAFCHCLSNEARLIFIFRDIASLPYAEISQIMEKDEAYIRKILSRSRTKVGNFMTNNCFLFNPSAHCKCRIKKHIIDTDLHKHYRSIEKTARLIKFFKHGEKVLPQKNFWERIIQTVTKA
jgi:RNA polymerase sigma factor (sigma-70 family)